MATATAVRVAIGGGKPKELADMVELLVKGPTPEQRGESSDSEYLEEQWWPGDDEADDVDGGHR